MPCIGDMNADRDDCKINIYKSLLPEPDSSPGVQTDHPHTGSCDKKSSGKSDHHVPKRCGHTQCSLHHKEGRSRHGYSSTSFHGKPRPHRSHIWPPPCPFQCCEPQGVSRHSLKPSCILFCHTVHTWEVSALKSRNSRMPWFFVAFGTYHIPWLHCMGVWPHQQPLYWLESVSLAPFGSQPSYERQSFS